MNKNGVGPPTPTPKYLHEFSKALASEVRILLEDVGKLRDERRLLQFEVAELMRIKSRHGAGGEYAPDWMPAIEAPPPPEPEPVPAIEAPPVAARPGWRVVHKRPERRPRPPPSSRTPAPPPAPVPVVEPPRPELPAWAQWRPNPLLAPTPVPGSGPSSPRPPARKGIFGPPTPPPR